MSDPHDHSHEGHDHDHDHGHEHHHHDHDHGHEHSPAPAGAPMEDAGSQALADALRSSFAIVKILMVVLAALFVFSGVFKVEERQRAIVLRFGKPQGQGNSALLGPGFHWAFPPPIDEVVIVPITELQKVTSTVGWYFTTPEKEFANQEDPPGPSLNPAADGYTITGDGNIIHVRATLNYHIEDPIRFVFNFVNASNAVQNALDNSLLYVSAHYKVDDVLTRDKTGFRERVQEKVTELIRDQKLGVVVDQCQVDSKPPRQLKMAFDTVLTALSARDKAHNEALSYENQVVSTAAADAAGRTNRAVVEGIALVESVKAEGQRFQDLLPKYRLNPALFTSLILNQKISEILKNVQDKIYLPERADGKSRELRLMLSREPQKAVSTTPNP